MNIIEYKDKYKEKTISLILDILENEYGYYMERPDIYDIKNTYQKNNGNFWLVIDDTDNIIGTIGIINYNNGRAYLKRFFLDKKYRGQGIGKLLLNKVAMYCKEKSYKSIFLGTTEEMTSGIKFYEKMDLIELKVCQMDYFI